MKFSKVPINSYKEMLIGPALLITNFDPTTGEYADEDIFMATSGGISFSATPTFTDFAAGIDGAPENMMEFKRSDGWQNITISGTGVSLNTTSARRILAMADVGGEHIVPRNNLDVSDFFDLWMVGDYSDKNREKNGGFIAVHLMNALSTGGFSIQTTDKEKGKFDFTFQAHYSIENQDTVPFEIYIKAGTEETA